MQLNFVYDPDVAAAPAAFKSGLALAAQAIGEMITDQITVNLYVKYYDIGGTTLALGGPDKGASLPYAEVVSQLSRHATNAAERQNVALLPAVAPAGMTNVYVSPAQEKAWGLISPTATDVDGILDFSSVNSYYFDPAHVVATAFGFVGIAEHEITHALARIRGDGPFDLIDYSAPGVRNPLGAGGGYFSIDGGKTNLGDFATVDPSDWNGSNDSFDGITSPGSPNGLTLVDKMLMGALGFNVDPVPAPPPPPPPVPPVPIPPPPPVPHPTPDPPPTPPVPPANPTPPPTPGLNVFDTTTGQPGSAAMQDYAGPVAGILRQIIAVTSDSLNITATTPSWFIHSGSGNDAIAVSSGTNVLDGGTGSNFLTGGSGSDTFFVDARAAASAIWSTVVGFHSGDNLTVWGVTKTDFAISWLDGQGAAGFTGLTAGFTALGKANVNLTLTGFTLASITSGQLSVSFGATADSQGIPGSTFMNIRAA